MTQDNAVLLPPWLQRWEDDGGTWRGSELTAFLSFPEQSAARTVNE